MKQNLDLGLKLKKVHRDPSIKSYIDLDTKLRSKATFKFDEDQAKLMNKLRMNCKLSSNWNQALHD